MVEEQLKTIIEQQVLGTAVRTRFAPSYMYFYGYGGVRISRERTLEVV